jgi:myo-inositol-1(or 4)-monophosphatase
MDDEEVLGVLRRAAGAVAEAIERVPVGERLRPGRRAGQYHIDLLADDAAVAVLAGAGFGVLSEESGPSAGTCEFLAVLDPIDGSTNAAHGLPWFATSICVVDSEGPLASLVVNQANQVSYEATRGRGARRDGRPIATSRRSSLEEALVSVCGYPERWPRWRQYRALGAAALDICAVADGTVDAFWDVWPDELAPWDYLGAALVCTEAGGEVADSRGRDLLAPLEPRSPVAAATAGLLAALLEEAGGP